MREADCKIISHAKILLQFVSGRYRGCYKKGYGSQVCACGIWSVGVNL